MYQDLTLLNTNLLKNPSGKIESGIVKFEIRHKEPRRLSGCLPKQNLSRLVREKERHVLSTPTHKRNGQNVSQEGLKTLG